MTDKFGVASGPNPSIILLGAVTFPAGQQTQLITTYTTELLGKEFGVDAVGTFSYFGLTTPSGPIFSNLNSATGEVSVKLVNSSGTTTTVNYIIITF